MYKKEWNGIKSHIEITALVLFCFVDEQRGARTQQQTKHRAKVAKALAADVFHSGIIFI